MAEALWVSSQLAGWLGLGIAVNPTTRSRALWILVRPLAPNRASAVVAFGRHPQANPLQENRLKPIRWAESGYACFL
jgi:hypothetical protein